MSFDLVPRINVSFLCFVRGRLKMRKDHTELVKCTSFSIHIHISIIRLSRYKHIFHQGAADGQLGRHLSDIRVRIALVPINLSPRGFDPKPQLRKSSRVK